MRLYGRITIKKDILKFIACPVCHSELVFIHQQFICKNPACRRQYISRNEIPVLIAGQSECLDPCVHRDRMKEHTEKN